MTVVKVVGSFIIFVLLGISSVEAAIINAKSCSVADVATAVTAASAGDTVQIPASTCTWTTTLTVNKGITIAGAGIGSTIVVDGLDRSSSDLAMFEWITAPGQTVRLTGITFSYASPQPTYNGSIRFWGASKAVRIDHVHFNMIDRVAIRVDGFMYGVMDHNVFDLPMSIANGVRVGHSNWNGQNFGDGSWADDPKWGTEQAFFLEDNQFYGHGMSGSVGPAVNDINNGGRVVFRYNQVYNSFFQGHSFEIRSRGARLAEVYNNTFSWNDLVNAANFAIFFRTGTLRVWGNTSTGYINLVNVVNDRSYRTDVGGAVWGTCGTWSGAPSNWDQNTDSSGFRCLDQVGAGKSDLLPQVENPTPAWPHQATEPAYEWNNSWTAPPNYSRAALWGAQSNVILQNRDYFLSTMAPNYTPFTYPHPLITGSTAVASPPSNLNLR